MSGIMGVSDVSVGYGSPEVLELMSSLSSHYGEEATLIEPDEITRPPLDHYPFANVKVRRLRATYQTYSMPFRIEYLDEAARLVNEARPDVLVVFCTFTLPLLFKLDYKPRFVLYHCYELASKYGERDIEINRLAARKIDLITFPEENRARIDIENCGFHTVPKAIVYNCGDVLPQRPEDILPADARSGRIIYTGTLDMQNALSGHFMDDSVQGIPIDIYGRITDEDPARRKRLESGFFGSVVYHGLVDYETLVERRRQAIFSVLLWNPLSGPHHVYAAPNRLFSAIQSGVPVISPPHPQCVKIIERYGCGLLMEDWELSSFVATLKEAVDLYGTDEYAEMVEACRKAAMGDLNWPAQFKKIVPFLPDL